jgi:hypothetical protein
MNEMPRHSVVYDKELKDTQEFKTLYGRYHSWSTRIYRDIFPTFQEFYDWSMSNNFVCGARLARKDPSKPYTQDNCLWVLPEGKEQHMTVDERKEIIDRWNETVNRIRVHYGLEPFERKEIESDETLL